MIASIRAIVSAVAGMVSVAAAQAMPLPVSAPAEQGLLCRAAIQQAEAGSGLPSHMLAAIGRVESGRVDRETGHFHPWPWTINAEGQGHYFESKAEAITFAQQLRARGVLSFDVGCLQVNLKHHAGAFRDLEEAFDPAANARYAVRFLSQLRDKTGSWETASAWYHSANPVYGDPYRAQVVTAMAAEEKISPTLATLPVAARAAAPLPAATPALPAMFAPHGIVIMQQRPYGAISQTAGLGGSAGTMPQLASTTTFGRGLDSYRAQPVRLMQSHLAAR